ncbi:unnamed protein product [Dibothriocephalus latus]|uniref:Uncharacterized protein n=1 Tax=Dibothriocephalus latus TaxID=60516 RepID=A0A3P7R6P1_DIBLA|nr:unnamed protein product [Dibothriocephalus latus]
MMSPSPCAEVFGHLEPSYSGVNAARAKEGITMKRRISGGIALYNTYLICAKFKSAEASTLSTRVHVTFTLIDRHCYLQTIPITTT